MCSTSIIPFTGRELTSCISLRYWPSWQERHAFNGHIGVEAHEGSRFVRKIVVNANHPGVLIIQLIPLPGKLCNLRVDLRLPCRIGGNDWPKNGRLGQNLLAEGRLVGTNPSNDCPRSCSDPLIADVEKGLVVNDGTTHAASELIQAKWGSRPDIEEVPRIEHGITHKIKRSP